MYYSSGNYEAFARPKKPEGVDNKSAYIVGSGLAALTAACYLVRDGQMKGERVHILEKGPTAGGACDGWKFENIGYVMRGGREMDNHFEVMWDLFHSIPSIETEGVSVLDEATMLEYSAERGGDPDRPGKRGRLDPMLWRGHRDGEPSWESERLGPGRPGWHIECTAIALEHLGEAFDVQGGGSDLVFPHHEMCAAEATAATGQPFARAYVHGGMVGYEGEKMSKSKGNLVLVSKLRAQGVDPMAIRLVLLDHHYRSDWEYTDADLERAQGRLAAWRSVLNNPTAFPADETIAAIRDALRDDLDAPAALAAVDAWVAASAAVESDETDAVGDVLMTVDALLGVRV